MRRTWIGLWTGAVVFSLVGCNSSGVKRAERPTLVEEYRLPPEDDLRYSTAVTYPKEALNQGIIKKDTNPGQPMPGMGSRAGQFGAGGMGRGGY